MKKNNTNRPGKVLLLLSSTIALIILLSACHQNKEQKRLAALSSIPPFTIVSPDSSRTVKSRDLPIGKPYIFMYFSPDCEHCQRMTRELITHRRQLEAARIYMVSPYPAGEVASFALIFHLDTMNNVFVGTDYQYSFFRAFLPKAIPYIVVYNSKNTLRMISTGEFDIDEVVNILQN